MRICLKSVAREVVDDLPAPLRSKIYINHWQGSTNLKFGRVTLKIWQGECKTWQGGPKRMLLDVARHISIIGRVLPS